MPRHLMAICTAASAALFLSPALAFAPVLALSPTAVHAGNGDDLTAQELSDRAEKALRDAKSVHMKLTDRSEGTDTSTTLPTSMELSLDQDGNCVGAMEMGSNGGSVEIVKRGEEVWMKPDADFWKAQAPGSEGEAIAELFKNRYIHGSTSDATLKGMADTCDLDSFQEKATGGADDAKTLKKGDETTVDGEKVIPVTSKEDGRTTTLYITSDDDHRLIKATEKGDGSDITMDFTDYDKPVPSKTPSADDSVDVSELESELQKV